MTRLSIKTRLLLLIILTAIAVVVLRYDGYVKTRHMANAARELYDTQVVPLEAALAIRDQMRHDLLDVPLRVKLGLMSPQQASAAVSQTAAGLATKWERFQSTATAPRLRQTVVTAEPLVARAESAAPRLAAILAGGGGPALDEVLREVHPLVEEFDNEFNQASSLVRDEAGRRYQETQAQYRRGILFSTIGAGLTLAVVLGIGWSIGRTLVSALAQVKESGARVTSSSTQLAASSRQLESVIAQQVASTTQVEGTAHQIASTAATLSGTMQEISRRADEAQATARRGFDGLKRIGQAMGGMDAATSLVSDRLATINAKAANITGVVTTITKVADQTNLLSLNASIEAVKAGELGHGFGVVAQEIRRLADQTAVATLDIEQIVKEMQAAVASGVMGMDKLAEQVREAVDEVSRFSVELRRGIEDVTALIQRFGTFNEGMASQSTGARDISQALSQLSTGAAETSRTLKESLHVAAQLDDTARRLSDEVAGFGMA